MLALSVLGLAPAASASTIHVNCATQSLQNKINGASPGSTLLIKGTCHGHFHLKKNITLKGDPTAILDGDGTGRTLAIGGVHTVHLRSLVVTGGKADHGGGIDMPDGGVLTLDKVTLKANLATADGAASGGGLDAQGFPTVTIRDSQILGNRSIASGSSTSEISRGGGVNIYGGTLTVENSVVGSNLVRAGSSVAGAAALGGGVGESFGALNIASSRFEGNRALVKSGVPANAAGGAVGWTNDSPFPLTIRGSTFRSNAAAATATGTGYASASGGALLMSELGSADLVTVAGSTFDDNYATASSSGNEAGGRGGAISLQAGTESQNVAFRIVSSRVRGSSITANGGTKASGFGGGLNMAGSGALLGSTVSANSVTLHSGSGDALGQGGGYEWSGTFERLTVTGSTIGGNKMSAESDSAGVSLQGGGIRAVGSVRLERSTLSGNVLLATGHGFPTNAAGGGLELENSSKPTVIVNSTITGNRVNAGAGHSAIAVGGGVEANDSNTVRLEYATIARNRATATGGDSAGEGGGVHVTSGSPRLEGVILASNSSDDTPTAGSGPNCSGTITSDGYNLFGKRSGCTFTKTQTDQVGVVPKLGPLADNGGPTKTLALLSGSPALNKVPANTCHKLVKRDQRHVARPQGKRCDKGAYERKVPDRSRIRSRSAHPRSSPTTISFSVRSSRARAPLPALVMPIQVRGRRPS